MSLCPETAASRPASRRDRDGGAHVARVTLQTIADRVGVSRMTVSNAFSRPDQLSAEMRRTILDAAAELGYVGPDPSARALARGTTGAVGVLLTESVGAAFRDPIAAAFFGAVAEELAPTGLAVVLLPATGAEGMIPARDIPMDAALVYGCAADYPAVDWLVRRRLPLVFVDGDPRPGSASVILDEREGARLAAQHLLDLGHRRIATFTMNVAVPPGWAPDVTTAAQRLRRPRAPARLGRDPGRRRRHTGHLRGLRQHGAVHLRGCARDARRRRATRPPSCASRTSWPPPWCTPPRSAACASRRTSP